MTTAASDPNLRKSLWGRIARTALGLILAPIVGGVIVIAMLDVGELVRSPGHSAGFLVTMAEISAFLGVPPALVIGWPLHLLLLRTRMTHLPVYLGLGVVLGIVALLVMSAFTGGPSRFLDETELLLLVAGAGAIGALLFWLIRRPDKDPREVAPADPAPPAA